MNPVHWLKWKSTGHYFCVPGVLPSVVSSSEAKDGIHVSKSRVEHFLGLLGWSLNAHVPDRPFSAFWLWGFFPFPPSSNRSALAEPGGRRAYGKLGTSEASDCVGEWFSPPQARGKSWKFVPWELWIWRRVCSFGVWVGHRESLTLVWLGGHLPNESHVPFLPLGLDEYEEWAWRVEHLAQKEYSQALRISTCLGPAIPFFFPISPFGMLMSILCLPTMYFGST